MELRKLIEDLQYLLDSEGNIEVYQASDEEGNYIREVEDVNVDSEYEGSKRYVIIWPNSVDLNGDC